MTDTFADDPSAAVARALEAAQLATDAAHEAEAVILARSEAMAAMERGAKRCTIMAAVMGGAALLSLLMGGAIWWRAGADLRAAGEVQAGAASAFVERLIEMNAALDRMDAAQLAFATGEASLAARLDRIEARLAAPAATADTASLPGEDSFDMRIEALRADLLAAITEAELATAERLVQLTATVSAAQAPAAAQALAPRPSPVAEPRASAGTARPVARPDGGTRRQAPAPQPNPFRYP